MLIIYSNEYRSLQVPKIQILVFWVGRRVETFPVLRMCNIFYWNTSTYTDQTNTGYSSEDTSIHIPSSEAKNARLTPVNNCKSNTRGNTENNGWFTQSSIPLKWAASFEIKNNKVHSNLGYKPYIYACIRIIARNTKFNFRGASALPSNKMEFLIKLSSLILPALLFSWSSFYPLSITLIKKS